ncbi:MAG: metal-activated pyridoxal enzyme [Actinobacteria bacterium]|nr:MAG: metal-activated pyridoxal enzyme [Actinomycetota bacterium]
MQLHDLATPALIVDADDLQYNLATMAGALPSSRCRPHVKAHKCTALAAEQAAVGHRTFTCATPLEMIGMAKVSLGEDLLLANETVDPGRLSALAALTDARVTVAVDSEATIDAAAKAGIAEVLIDVNVGLPRCGCDPEEAGRLADQARSRGLAVRGVMGYEGHVMPVVGRADRAAQVEESMAKLRAAHDLVGGEVTSAGGTGTYDLHQWASEIQCGSYALMDTYYARLELPFRQALAVWGTVISVSAKWMVCDVGLKSLGMDHGDPSIDAAKVWFCSDEHTTFAPEAGGRLATLRVGDHVRVLPAHVDPTMALHDRLHIIQNDEVVDTWAIDLRGW